MDHCNYTMLQEEEMETSDECYTNVNISHNKYGDELLIDLVQSRPYLYDKSHREYKNSN